MNCEICQDPKAHVAEHEPVGGVIFNHQKPLEISLCYLHEQELFLSGQFRFLNKYKNFLSPRYFNAEDPSKKRDWF
jgi:hypothetical protein